jgi:hypothetical protein
MNHVIRRAADELSYRAAGLDFHLRHGQAAKPLILVNGSPKTGTTWMKLMLAAVPGFKHGGNFNGQIKRYAQAQPGLIYHGHDRLTPDLETCLDEREFRVIVTLRDPRDQLVSRMFHLRRDQRHPWHERVQTWDDHKLLMACIEGREDDSLPGVIAMHNITQSWLERPDLARLVRYEDLLTDADAEMTEVFAHVGLHIGSVLRRRIVARNAFDRLVVGREIWRRGRKAGEMDPKSHFRKGVSGDWRQYFEAEHIAQFKQLANSILVEFGYERDDSWD